MAVVAAYETKQGKRYRVRYRTPDNRQGGCVIWICSESAPRSQRMPYQSGTSVRVGTTKSHKLRPKPLSGVLLPLLARQREH